MSRFERISTLICSIQETIKTSKHKISAYLLMVEYIAQLTFASDAVFEGWGNQNPLVSLSIIL